MILNFLIGSWSLDWKITICATNSSDLVDCLWWGYLAFLRSGSIGLASTATNLLEVFALPNCTPRRPVAFLTRSASPTETPHPIGNVDWASIYIWAYRRKLRICGVVFGEDWLLDQTIPVDVVVELVRKIVEASFICHNCFLSVSENYWVFKNYNLWVTSTFTS